MHKKTWIIASVLSALAVAGLIGLSFWKQKTQFESVQEELNHLRAEFEQKQCEANSLNEEVNEGKKLIADLKQEKEKAAQAQKTLEAEMRSALQSKDVTISELQGKLTVNILDRVLFDSGEAELKPEGHKVLEQVAGVLVQYPKRQIHVIGHTDDVPIRVSARSRFASNWELSTARATAAVRFLQEQAGVDPHRLGAVGYSEFHPIADNSTPEGRAKNRRIAIVVLPEELAAVDVPPVTAAPPEAPKPKPEVPTADLPKAGSPPSDPPQTAPAK